MKYSRRLSFVFSVGIVCILSTLIITFYYGRQVTLMNRHLLAQREAIGHLEMFDLLLCDIGLPDGTGMDFLKEIRKFDQTPAVALSGFGMDEDIARCEEAGFFTHLTKPIDLQRLDAIIRNLPKH